VTEQELLAAIRFRICDTKSRIDASTVPAPPLFATAPVEAIHAAEAALGFGLPLLLRRLYLSVANGGFGPGGGILGVGGGYTDLDGKTLTTLYLALRSQRWPQEILPFCDLGDAAWCCLDRRSGDDHIMIMSSGDLTRTSFTLFSWVEAWVSGADLNAQMFEFQDFSVVNPLTRRPLMVKARGRAKGDLVESFGP